MRKDLSVLFGHLDDVLDFVLFVGVVHRGGVDDGIFVAVIGAHGQEDGLGRVDVKPLGKEQIDLVDVRLEGGIAGRVVLDIVGGAQTFTGVEGDVRGFAAGFAAGGTRGLLTVEKGSVVGQSLVVVPGSGQQQLRQLLIAEDVEDKNREDEGENDGSRIQNAAQPLPALSLRVEKYLSIGHEWA